MGMEEIMSMSEGMGGGGDALKLKHEREENTRLNAEKAESDFAQDFGPIATELRNVRRRFHVSANDMHTFYDRIQILKNAIKGKITAEMVLSESNQEVSRAMLAVYGFDNFIQDANAITLAEDEYGTLLSVTLQRELSARESFRDQNSFMFRNSSRMEFSDPREIRAVRVKNSTPEPDGSVKEYILRVPPWTETPQEGLAWTFGFEKAEDYNPNVMT